MKKALKETLDSVKKPLDKISGKELEQAFKQHSEMLETILSGMSVKLSKHDKTLKEIKSLQAALAELEGSCQRVDTNSTPTSLIYASFALSLLSLGLVVAFIISNL